MLTAPTILHPTKEQFLIALEEIEKFSPAPVILANALKLLRDPQSDVESIAALVGSDPALATDIIRCSNSAFYAGGSCTNIADAVQKIGSLETIRLLNLAVARIASGRDLGCYGIHGADFWAESLFNGLFLQALAKETGEADPDEAYTVGLLRFIGRLAINETIENLRGGLFWIGLESITQWEQDNVGVIQAQAGAMLLAKWRFPEEIVQAIARQDAPETLEEKNWMAEALFFASALLPQGIGTPFMPSVDNSLTILPVGSDFMHHYGLNPAAVEKLLLCTSAEFDRIRQTFGV
jgi:HD-like signal output (HDOD) protein